MIDPNLIDVEKYFKQGQEYQQAWVAIGGTFDENLFDKECDLIELYIDWKRSLPKLDEAEWLAIFPQAKKRYGRLIKGKLKIEKKYVIQAIQQARTSAINAIRENSPENGWVDEYIRENLQRKTEKFRHRIQEIDNFVRVVERIGRKIGPGESKGIAITPEMIARAKEYPLDKLIEINKGKFTKCFAHEDKTPSAYCKGNFIHCFVCQKQWDTIAVLMERDGLTFKQAVMQLQ